MNIKQTIEAACKGGWKYRGRPNIRIDVIGDSREVNIPQRPPFNLLPRIIATFDDGYVMNLNIEVLLLDPSFWAAVGKVEGWKDENCKDCGEELGRDEESGMIFCPNCPYLDSDKSQQLNYGGRKRMHRLVDALCDHKTLEEAVEIATT